METHHLETPRTARYHTLGERGRCEEAWFLLHGYGQRAAELLEACLPLASPQRLLIAPEALSRFYLRGGQGPVGASWMTREDREVEIRDLLRWLDALAARATGAEQPPRRCALGFSQGAAAAWRWALLGRARIDRFVAWGGAIPPDLDLASAGERLARLRIQLVRGAGDEVYGADALQRDCRRLAEVDAHCELASFDGDHRVDEAALRALTGS